MNDDDRADLEPPTDEQLAGLYRALLGAARHARLLGRLPEHPRRGGDRARFRALGVLLEFHAGVVESDLPTELVVRRRR
jgi:hypothetical protein